MPAMAAAYATLDSAAVPRATSALNVHAADRRLARHGAAGRRAAGRDQRPAARRPAGGGGATLERLPDAVRAAARRPAGGGVRRHVLVGGGDVGARADPGDHARGRRRRARARARRARGRGARARAARRCEARSSRATGSRRARRAARSRSCTGWASTAGATSGSRRASPTRASRCGRSTCAGTGRARARAATSRFAPALEDIDALVARCGASGAGVPVFVYGHSLGALLTCCGCSSARRRRWRARSFSAIGLHSALREQAVKVRAARVLGRAPPKARVKSGIDPATLSRDPDVVAGVPQGRARPRHRLARLRARRARGGSTRSRPARRSSRSRCSDPRQRGRAGLRVRRARARRRSRRTSCTLQVYDGLFHEVHNEPEQERVFADVLAWIEQRLASASSPS